jgi:lipoprotein-anchoring transpeptidase ErfK/SrfK
MKRGKPAQTPFIKKEWMPYLVVGGAAIFGILAMIGIIGVIALVYLSSGGIPSGVSVAGVNIGGKSASDAQRVLAQKIPNTISVSDGSASYPVSLADLGVKVDMDATLKAAEKAHSGAQLTPVYTIDLKQAETGLVALSQQVNVAAVPGNPPKKGRAIEIPTVLDRLRQNVSGELSDGALDLTMIDVDPPEQDATASYSGVKTTHVVQAGQELGLIAKEYNVSMQDIITLNNITNPDLLYVGQELTIPAASIYEPTAADAPPAPTNSGKSIVVSLDKQRIYAYENGQLVHSHLASTGLPATPTVKGDFKIYVKYVADDMSGPGYFLPQVPYTMYFYQGYGIHGTYWHNSFGRPMSHGCVNLPTDEAKWFFDWASVGTPVRVI